MEMVRLERKIAGNQKRDRVSFVWQRAIFHLKPTRKISWFSQIYEIREELENGKTKAYNEGPPGGEV